MSTIVIAGITGMDGSYLSEHLLAQGHEVHGFIRRLSNPNNKNIAHIEKDLILHQTDVTDALSISGLVKSIQPDYFYNLAAQSHLGTSWEVPGDTIAINAVGAFNIMEAIRLFSPNTRLFTAITAEVFGISNPPQDENTPINPNSPYACSKAFAYFQSKNYRERYGLHLSNGLLFNHTSPRRPESFVTRKITKAVHNIKLGIQDKLELGNINISVDIGFAPDFVKAYSLIVEGKEAGDYIIGTGETHTIKEFLEIAFNKVDLCWEDYVVINPEFYRPLQNSISCANISKIKKDYNWEPSISFTNMVELLVESEFNG